MSEILIKNVEMPKKLNRDMETPLTNEEHLTLRIMPDGKVYRCLCSTNFFADRILNMEEIGEVVQVKHGDLIDKDELVGTISDTYCENCCEIKPTGCHSCEMERVMEIIRNAPVLGVKK